MALPIQFTLVYDWLAQRRDISWPEKIIIAHILRYDKSEYGCFKSNSNIAKSLGFSKYHGRVAVIRIINRLHDADWIIKRTYPARERSLFINREKLDNMPLLAGIKGRKKPVSKPVKLCGKPVNSLYEVSGCEPPHSGCEPLPLSGCEPLPLNRNRKQSLLLNKYERKEERDFSSSKVRERAKPTAVEFEHNRQKLIDQVKNLQEK